MLRDGARPGFLVTGSTGFIGRRLVDRLVERYGPASVICLAKAPSTAHERRALASQHSRGLHVIEADLADGHLQIEPIPQAMVVFHLAANIDTDAPEHALRVNDAGTLRLLRLLSARPVGLPPRIVYASSIAVHDRSACPTRPISETSPLVPRTAYGKTKLRGESVLRESGQRGECSWTILRLPTVYGPGQKPDGLIGRLTRLVAGRTWLGRIDWPGRTSIIHVDDLVDAMIDLSSRPETSGEVYCVASDESLTVGEIAQGIARAMGRPIVPIPVEEPLLSVARALVWSRVCRALIPPLARLSFWRLSLMLSDGFWFDTAKFRRVYPKPMRTLSQGIADTLVSNS